MRAHVPWAPATHVGSLDGVPGSWLPSGPALAVEAISTETVDGRSWLFQVWEAAAQLPQLLGGVQSSAMVWVSHGSHDAQ